MVRPLACQIYWPPDGRVRGTVWLVLGVLLPGLHLGIAQPEMVPDLVDDGQAHLADHVRVGFADGLDVALVDDDHLGQLVRGERGLLELARAVIEAEDVTAELRAHLGGRAILHEHGDVAQALGKDRRQVVQRPLDEALKRGPAQRGSLVGRRGVRPPGYASPRWRRINDSTCGTIASQSASSARVIVMKSLRKKTCRMPAMPSRSRASGASAVWASVNVRLRPAVICRFTTNLSALTFGVGCTVTVNAAVTRFPPRLLLVGAAAFVNRSLRDSGRRLIGTRAEI